MFSLKSSQFQTLASPGPIMARCGNVAMYAAKLFASSFCGWESGTVCDPCCGEMSFPDQKIKTYRL